MARLSRSCTQPSRELSYSTPLSQPFCEPVRLFSGREPGKLRKDLAEELPEEAADGLDTNAAGEGQGGRGAGVRPGCGAASPRNVRKS